MGIAEIGNFDPDATWHWIQTRNNVGTTGTLADCLQDLSPFFATEIDADFVRIQCLMLGYCSRSEWYIKRGEFEILNENRQAAQ
jgi:hypothetical protein